MTELEKLIELKSPIITQVTNQIVTTVYTKKQTVCKLKNNYVGVVVNYRLEEENNNFSIRGNSIVVNRGDVNHSIKNKLYADILNDDGKTLLYSTSWDLELLSTQQADELELEELRYTNNKLSQMLGYCALILGLFAALIVLNSVKPGFLPSMIYILGNICLLLVGFLASEKVKAHNKQYSIVMLVIGVIFFLSIFWLPLQLIIHYGDYLKAVEANDQALLELIKKKYLGAAITDSPVFQSILPQSGYLRATMSIVLLSLSTVCASFSAVIAYKKSVKLEKYLQANKK